MLKKYKIFITEFSEKVQIESTFTTVMRSYLKILSRNSYDEQFNNEED
jgi:hypothetical protein